MKQNRGQKGGKCFAAKDDSLIRGFLDFIRVYPRKSAA
jgi:hypothetical protein